MSKRKWITDDLEDIVGVAEACEILGVEKATLIRWMKPGSGSDLDFGGFGPDRTYMCTWTRVAAGPVWSRADVVRHREDIGRRRAPAASRREGVSEGEPGESKEIHANQPDES